MEKPKIKECISVYFISTTKIIINFDFNLDKSFEEILYRIDKRIWVDN